MTRTILNWSELVDQYQGRIESETSKLKKWSEMGETHKTRSSSSLELKEPEKGHYNRDIDEPWESEDLRRLSEHKSIIEEILNDEEFDEFLERKYRKIVEESESESNLEVETKENKYFTPYNRNPVEVVTNNQARFLEIVYDTLMQDTETIPTMYPEHLDDIEDSL